MSKIDTSGYFFHDHPATCDPDDFWGQVKRTVNGKTVDQRQIDLIIEGIVEGTDLKEDDYILDLCCGNGALSRYIFPVCSGGIGVDFSDFLIDVANKNFAVEGRETYLLGDVLEYASDGTDKEAITKMFCFGSFQYLPVGKIEELLRNLYTHFPNLERCFIGNLPDKSKAAEFYKSRNQPQEDLEDSTSAIGFWWDSSEFKKVAESAGWRMEFGRLPQEFYASTYRFNATLLRDS
ncbi:MAG: class I SAM-dependent methyltransferase [Planctomycetaceae bacterium]|jgi:cyclopropane fatty-acyl-phospholipid synthase-like methyltransferase|nr:class I SAM-dependent methyltransferase [Planctomycetaceae bacterium]